MNLQIRAEFVALLPRLQLMPLHRSAKPHRFRPRLQPLAASIITLILGLGIWGIIEGQRGTDRLAGVNESFESTLRQALDRGDPGSSFAYAEADQQGTVTIVGSIATVFGPCLGFRHDWTDRGGRATASGLACRSDDGDWSVLTPPPKQKP